MSRIWKVNIIESERGWGQKVDETLYFTDEGLATDYCNTFNSRNTELTTPDFYWRADMPIGIEIPEEDQIISTREQMEKRLPPVSSTWLTNKGRTENGKDARKSPWARAT